MKWLREHSKQIMVVVVLLAMFSFVGAEGLMMVLQPNPAKEVVMTAFGREYTQMARFEAQTDADTLMYLNLPWQYNPDLRITHFLLLSEEARQAGIEVSEEETAQWLAKIEEQLAKNNVSLEDLRQRHRLSRPLIRRALERMLLVNKNFSRLYDAAVPSEPQLRHFVKATEEKVHVKFTWLDAEKYIDAKEAISDDEAQAQFERYRDRLAAESDDGFGYKYPRRVKLQYVVISPAALEPQMTISDEEIREYWRAGDNRNKYMKTIMVDDVPPGSPADTQPFEAKKVPEQRVMELSEAIPAVRRDLAAARARKVARQVADRLADDLSRPWTQLGEPAPEGFRTIPEECRDPAYLDRIAKDVASKFNVTIEYGETPLVSAQDLGEHAAIKGATTPGDQGTPVALSDFAFRVPGFYDPAGKSDAGLRLQLFETPNPPMTVNQPGAYTFQDGRFVQTPGALEKLVIFRVVETAESGIPSTLAEVRDKVDRDLRLLHALDRMEPQAREIYAVARHLGLDKATPLFSDLRDRGVEPTPFTAPPFARSAVEFEPEKRDALIAAGKLPLRPASVSRVGEDAAFIDACFAMVDPAWVNPDVGDVAGDRLLNATTQPAVQPEPKVRTLRSTKQKKWYVVELVNSTPVDIEQYENTLRAKAFRTLAERRRVALSEEWFKPANIEARCRFKALDEAPPPDSAEGLKTAGAGKTGPVG